VLAVKYAIPHAISVIHVNYVLLVTAHARYASDAIAVKYVILHAFTATHAIYAIPASHAIVAMGPVSLANHVILASSATRAKHVMPHASRATLAKHAMAASDVTHAKASVTPVRNATRHVMYAIHANHV